MTKPPLTTFLIITLVLVVAFLGIFSTRFFIAKQGEDFKEQLVQNPSRYILKVSKQVNKGVAYYFAALNDRDQRLLDKAGDILHSSQAFLSNEFYTLFDAERDQLRSMIDELIQGIAASGLEADRKQTAQALHLANRIDRLVSRVEQNAWDRIMAGYVAEKANTQEIAGSLKTQNTLLNGLAFLFVCAFVFMFLFLMKLTQMQQQLESQQTSLRVNEDRLKEAQRMAGVGNWDVTLATGEATWSDEQFHILGYRPGEVEAGLNSLMESVHPEDRDKVSREMARSMRSDQTKPYHVEHRVLHKDGTQRVVEETGQTTFNEAGEPLRMFGTTLDVTARHQEEELRRRRVQGLQCLDHWMRRLGALLEQPQAFRDAVCEGILELVSADLAALPLLDPSNKTFTYDAAAGAEAGQLLGQTLPLTRGGLCGWVANHGEGICVPDLTQDPRVIQTLADNLNVNTGLLTPLTHDGRVIGGLSAFRNGAPFDNIDEELINLFGQRVSAAMDNMQLLSTLEQRVQDRTLELEVINKELESFAYSVSHDLRAPLRSIDGFSQALLEDYEEHLDATGQDYLGRVRRACQRMGSLIDDLLMLSRLTRRDMQCEPVDLGGLALQSIEQLRKDMPERSVKLRIAQGVSAEADVKLMRILFDNLMGNAWKYTAREPEAVIEFGRQVEDGQEVYFIRDNGVGFDMAYADKLFGAFQRLHKSGDFEGSGIGLATVARIVHRHGGRVWAEGQMDRGATFYFTLA